MGRADTYDPYDPGETDEWASVGPAERGASLTLGALLLALALARRRGFPALVAGLVGAYLGWRGVTGRCAVCDALDLGTRVDEEEDRLATGRHIDRSEEAVVLVDLPTQDVYAFCRQPSNLPRFLSHLRSVEEIDEAWSRWLAADGAVWESEILEDRPGELIVWRSRPGSGPHHELALSFLAGPEERGTEVRADVEYAHLGREAQRELDEDLRRLKGLLEA